MHYFLVKEFQRVAHGLSLAGVFGVSSYATALYYDRIVALAWGRASQWRQDIR